MARDFFVKVIASIFCLSIFFGGVLAPINFNTISQKINTDETSFLLTVFAEDENPQIAEQAPQKTGAVTRVVGAVVKNAPPVYAVRKLGGLLGNTMGGGIAAQITKLPFTGLMVVLAILAAGIALLSSVVAGIFYTILEEALRFNTEELVNMVTGEGGVAIREAWTIFRDLGNIGLVFILIYIAINFIIQANSSETSKLLGRVIIGALLINFSFFFSAIVIDVSNSLAKSVHQTIQEEMGHEHFSIFLAKKMGIDAVEKIAEQFFIKQGGAGIENILKNLTFGFDLGSGILFGSILVLIFNAAFIIVSIMMIFLFITRVIMLLLLLAVSPIGVVSFILPQTKNISKEYWQSLVGQSFSLPIFFLFFLVAIKIINNTPLLANTDQWTPPSGFNPLQHLSESVVMIMPSLLPMALVIGLLIAAVSASKKATSMGSSMVTKLSGSITATVGGVALGSAAFAGRNTAGWGANKLANTRKFKKFATDNPRLGGYLLDKTHGVANASFDARGSKLFSGVASATGVGDKAFGELKDADGYKGRLKKAQEKKTTFAAEAIGQDSKDTRLNAATEMDVWNLGHRAETVGELNDAILAQKDTLDDLKSTNAAQADITAARTTLKQLTEMYAEVKNTNLETYAQNIARPIINIGGVTIPALPTDRKVNETMMKELAKAQKSHDYDIISKLKAAKGDTK